MRPASAGLVYSKGEQMRKTKAAFRALREECGLTQADVAAEAGCTVQTVKKWENPASHIKEPPDDVWAFLLELRGAMHEDARLIAEQIIESCVALPGAHDLQLDYYRTQACLDAVQLPDHDEPVGYVNARMRLVGQLLDKAEIPYTYRYRP